MKKLPQISEAEYEVMKAVWRQSPAGTNEIVERILPVTDWQPNTVHTLLKRLVKKGVLDYRKRGRMFEYFPLISEEEYLGQKSKSFLEQYFGGSIMPLFASYLEEEDVSGEELEELRAIPAEKIVELQEEFGRVNPSRMLSFVPNIDNHLLTCGYNDAVTEGKIKDIPYMLGSTADDIGVFPEMKEKGEHGGIYKGCINWSIALEKLGRKPAYVYYFTRALLGDDAGAFHSSELWYMFGTLGRSWRPKTEGDYALSKEMMDDWTNFMKTGNPNAEGKDDWKPCTKDDPYVQVLDVRK